MKTNIDFGVSLYGFTEQWCGNPDFGFEDMFKELQKLGIKKFEVVGPQMFESYPIPTDEEFRHVLSMCEKYGVAPYSYSGYVDVGKYSDRDMNDQEMMIEVIMDLQTAHKLGCQYMRTSVPSRLVKDVAVMAELYNVKVGFEVHSPSRPSDADIQELLKQIQASGSSHVGFIPDFGCFIEKPNPLLINRYKQLGAKPELLDFIVENRHNGYTETTIWEKIQGMGGGKAEQLAISELFGFLSFAPADMEGFKTLLPWCLYFHGKFYHINEDCVETTIPYEELLHLIVDSGFEGTIMTEYEGHCFYLNDAAEQIGRHLQMERNILSKINA